MIICGGLLLEDEASTLAGDSLSFSLEEPLSPQSLPLHVPRYLHAQVLSTSGATLLLGGLVTAAEGLCATAAVERVDWQTGTGESLPSLPFATAEPLAVALPDGRILVAGGYDDDALATAAVLAPGASHWQLAPPLPSPRIAPSGPVWLDERHALFAGGWADLEGRSPTEALVLDTQELTWHPVEMLLPRGAALTDLGKGRFLVSGGSLEDGTLTDQVTLWTEGSRCSS